MIGKVGPSRACRIATTVSGPGHLARLIEEHGADTGCLIVDKSRGRLPERAYNGAEQSLRHLLSAAARAVSVGQGNLTPVGAAVALYRWRTRPLPDAFPGSSERQANHTHFRGSEFGAADEFSPVQLSAAKGRCRAGRAGSKLSIGLRGLDPRF
jgi:hypothetical protein